MAILEHDVRRSGGILIDGLQRHLYTRDEYYALGKSGLFNEQRIELIEGEILEMAPIGEPHSVMHDLNRELLRKAFGSGFAVRTQAPISLGDDLKPSDPQPDIAVAVGDPRDFLSHHPGAGDIKLVIEIAESSLAYDCSVKAALYAASDIPEYWIINLVDKQLEVYRNPVDGVFQYKAVLSPGQAVEPLHAAHGKIDVGELLP